jgi:hypothetical protein
VTVIVTTSKVAVPGDVDRHPAVGGTLTLVTLTSLDVINPAPSRAVA